MNERRTWLSAARFFSSSSSSCSPSGVAERERLLQADRGRHGRVGELVERLVAERGEHLGGLGLGRCDVAARERIGRSEEVGLHGRTVPARRPLKTSALAGAPRPEHYFPRKMLR